MLRLLGILSLVGILSGGGGRRLIRRYRRRSLGRGLLLGTVVGLVLHKATEQRDRG